MSILKHWDFPDILYYSVSVIHRGVENKPELQRVLEQRKRDQMIKQRKQEEEARKKISPLEQELLKRHKQLEEVKSENPVKALILISLLLIFSQESFFLYKKYSCFRFNSTGMAKPLLFFFLPNTESIKVWDQ